MEVTVEVSCVGDVPSSEPEPCWGIGGGVASETGGWGKEKRHVKETEGDRQDAGDGVLIPSAGLVLPAHWQGQITLFGRPGRDGQDHSVNPSSGYEYAANKLTIWPEASNSSLEGGSPSKMVTEGLLGHFGHRWY